jgi:hypothetical protein
MKRIFRALGLWDTGGWPRSVLGEIVTAPLRLLYVLPILLFLLPFEAFAAPAPPRNVPTFERSNVSTFEPAIEPTMYEASTELSPERGESAGKASSPRVFALPQTGGGGHSTALTWVLSTDDTTTACTTTANCLQNVYRGSGSCSVSTSFSLLTTTSLNATVTAFTDTTVTPGVWCYGVTFGINGLESTKDTVSVTLQPASPTGAAATTK